jgi:hypothetical protein
VHCPAHPEPVEGRGGGGVSPTPTPETAIETKSLPFPLRTVSTVSTCPHSRPAQQRNDILFPFGSPATFGNGRANPSRNTCCQEQGPWSATLSPSRCLSPR